MSDKNKTVKIAGRKGTKVSRDKAKSFSDVQNKQKHNRKQVKVYDSDTGKTTTLQKEGNTYYRGGQYVELTDSQKEIRGASMKKYGASQKKFPEIKKGNEGKFTRWVEKNMPGMDTCKAASKIMRSRTKKYSPAVVKMANYANNFGCKTKKEDGASDGASKKKLKGDFGKTISAKKFERKAKRNPKKTSSSGTIKSDPFTGNYSSKEKTVVNKRRKRFIAEEEAYKSPTGVSTSRSYYKQKKGKHY